MMTLIADIVLALHAGYAAFVVGGWLLAMTAHSTATMA
jgi:hypothetical protein